MNFPAIAMAFRVEKGRESLDFFVAINLML